MFTVFAFFSLAVISCYRMDHVIMYYCPYFLCHVENKISICEYRDSLAKMICKTHSEIKSVQVPYDVYNIFLRNL